jgi:hypothetical protein
MELAKKLAEYRDIKVIVDESDLKVGEDIGKWMRSSVKRSDVFIYVITPSSINSPNCQLELNIAAKNRKPIIPILLRDAILPNELSVLKHVDLRDKSLTFEKIDKIVEGIRFHFAQAMQTRNRTKTRGVKGVGSQPITAVAVLDDVDLGAWISRIDNPKSEFKPADSVLYLSLQNLQPQSREVTVSPRIRGEKVRFGPMPDLSMQDVVERKVALPSRRAVEVGFPFTVACDYVSGQAEFEITKGQGSIRLPIILGSDLEFKSFI